LTYGPVILIFVLIKSKLIVIESAMLLFFKSMNLKIKKMKKLVFSLLLFSLGTASFCTTWTIINVGFTFSPATVTIHLGDSVNFTLADIHNAVEVSQTTWDANGTTALPGGFQEPIGGGLVLPSQLAVGTHYYVCQPHASLGMKGIIIVQDNSGIADNKLQSGISVYPNPANNLLTIKAGNDLVGSQYVISDQTGRQVLNGKLANETTPIDISQLIPGVYLIQVAGQRRSSVKMIKN
jgi:plastocyanin